MSAASHVGLEQLTEIRAREPERVGRGWAERARRPLLGPDGRLLVVAADHSARGALGVRGDGMAMASRTDLLERLANALARPGVDGVLGTADVLDDLLRMGALEGKVVIGSMNRAGCRVPSSSSTTGSLATTPHPSPPTVSRAERC